MRRICSITTIATMLVSIAAPLLAANCPHVAQQLACHRMSAQQVHHCGMVHHHPGEGVAENNAVSESGLAYVAGISQSCPMDCCATGQPTNAIVITALLDLSPLLAAEQRLHVVPVIFTSAGFSSHTDRGPPTA